MLLLRNPLKPSFIKRMLFYAVGHFIITLGLVVSASGGAFEIFKDPDRGNTGLEAVAESSSRVLLQPALALWDAGLGDALPEFTAWGALALNSLVWGFVISYLISIIFRV